MGVDKPYREQPLKRELRRCCASKESRMGLPKRLSVRERWTMRGLCTIATLCLLGTFVLVETGCPIWMQMLCLVQCVLWCAVAGLYETASDWQRSALESTRRRSATIDRLLKEDTSGLSEAEIIAMTGEAADFGFASGDEVAEALREELGDE